VWWYRTHRRSAAQIHISTPVALEIPVGPADIADVRLDGYPHLLGIEPAGLMDPAVVKPTRPRIRPTGDSLKLLLLLRRANFFLERVAIGESHDDGILFFFSGLHDLTAFDHGIRA